MMIILIDENFFDYMEVVNFNNNFIIDDDENENEEEYEIMIIYNGNTELVKIFNESICALCLENDSVL